MCGRYTLTNKKEVKKKFEIDIEQNFNICPSSKVLVYTNKPEWMEWNYSPSWAKKPMNLINARYETIDEKPSFKDMNRCVLSWTVGMNGKDISIGVKERTLKIHTIIISTVILYL